LQKNKHFSLKNEKEREKFLRNAAALSPTTTTYTAATAATLVQLDERISLPSSSSLLLLLLLLGRRVRKGGNECANQSIEPEVNFLG
jgi:hypothetical protein